MTRSACAREHEVVAVVLMQRWPDGADADLVEHARTCDLCADVTAVAPSLRADYERTRQEAHLPSAGQVWWRAKVRARMDAAQTASRPITWVQAISAAGAAGLGIALLGIAWPSVARVLGWLGSSVARADSAGGELGALVALVVQRSLPLWLALGACLLIAPIALYLALSDE